MSEAESKIIAESLVDCAKMATANSLGFVKASLEGLKHLSQDWKTPLTFEQICDFLIIFFGEAIKDLDKSRNEASVDGNNRT